MEPQRNKAKTDLFRRYGPWRQSEDRVYMTGKTCETG